MKKLIILGLIVCALGIAPAFANVTLINDGFETGDTTGWTEVVPPNADISVVTSHSDPAGTGTTSWAPNSGDYFALLKTDGPGSITHLTQSFYAEAGEKLQFAYFWDAQDYTPFNDTAWAMLLGPTGGPVTLFSESVSNDGVDYWGTEWKNVSYTLTTTGYYSIDFMISNVGDSILDSRLGIDAYVPVPGAFLLGGIGVSFVGWLKRRRTL